MCRGLWVILAKKYLKTLPEIVDHLGTFGIEFSTKYDLGHINLTNYLYRLDMDCAGASADGRWNRRSCDCHSRFLLCAAVCQFGSVSRVCFILTSSHLFLSVLW